MSNNHFFMFLLLMSINLQLATAAVEDPGLREVEWDGCDNGDCLNGGGCINRMNCWCSSAWSGLLCEELDPNARYDNTTGEYLGQNDYVTEDVICRNGGSYVGYYDYENYGGGYDGYFNYGGDGPCQCFGPWTGANCGTHVCNNYCQNQGKCNYLQENRPARQINPQNEAVCSCSGGFLGSQCQYSCEESCSQNSVDCSYDPNRDVIVCTCAEGYYGNSCDKMEPPVVFDVVPNYGPVVGVTNVTIYGADVNYIEELVMVPQCTFNRTVCGRLSNITYFYFNFLYSSAVMLNFTTSSSQYFGFTGQVPGFERLKYKIYFLLENHDELYDTGFFFEYRPNPTILDVTPRNSILSGGIILTAHGTNLDSVFSPVLYVYMERRQINADQYIVLERFRFESNDITVYNGSVMLCPTPEIDLDSTDPIYTNQPSQISPFARKRRQTNMAINNETLEFYIGFELDGEATYRNLTETNPEAARLIVYNNPTFEEFDGTRSFDPNKEKTITIFGESLTNGAGQNDYSVEIGEGECTVVEVLDNVLVCEPPSSEPDIVEVSNFKSGVPRVFVNCGNLRFAVGSINYVKDWTLVYIIAGAVGGAVFLFLIILIIACCCCCNKSKDDDQTKPPQRPNERAVNQYNDVPMQDTREFPSIKT